jgi:flagellar hook-associated protein 3 FlgL
MIRMQEIARQSRLAQDIARLQTQVSSGRRIQRASDDPLASARVATIGTAQANDASWASNLTLASALTTQADGVLASLAERVTHARGLMVAGANGTNTAADRATYATALRGVADDVAALRMTRSSLDAPLFAGTAPASMRVEASVIVTPVADAATVFEPGGVPLTTMLGEAAAALEANDPARIGAALSALDNAVSHAADMAAAQGVQAARIDALTERNLVRGIGLAVERSTLEDTDLSAAIAELSTRQITLDAAQAAFARINRRTLFDLI